MKKLYSIIFTLQVLFFSTYLFAQEPITCGDAHTFFICSNGNLMGCGYNDFGQLGDSSNIQQDIPVIINSIYDIISVAGGREHSIFLKRDGTVWASGSNSYGQLGLGNNTSTIKPIQIATLSNIIAVSAGEYFSIFLKKDGTVWACGSNSNGQLGIGNLIDQLTPIQISSLSNIKSISTGFSHTLFLKNDGTVFSSGNNTDGQLGHNTTTNVLMPIQISMLTNIKSIKAGGWFSLFLRNDDSVFSCGNNNDGQLGIGTNTLQLIPTIISSIHNVSSLAAGWGHSIFLKNDGTVWSCGRNSSGELGQGSFSSTNIPLQITALSNIQSISAGGWYSVFLKNDFSTWACGWNGYGELGDGTTTSRNTPVNVAIGNCQPSLLLDTLSFYPTSSGTCGYTSLTFNGSDIEPNMHLKFTATGQPDIEVPDSNITYTSNNAFKANVDFSSASIGKYNVVITDSNGIATTITDGFEAQAILPPNLEIKVVGPTLTRVGLPTRYYLKITNNSNCVALAAPVTLFVSGNNKVTFVDSIYDFEGHKQDTMLYAELENYFGNDGKSKGYIFMVNPVPANGSIFYPIDITALSPHEPCKINASVGLPTVDISKSLHKKNRFLGIPLTPAMKQCAESIAINTSTLALNIANVPNAASVTATQCVTGVMTTYTDYVTLNNTSTDFALTVGNTVVNCLATVALFTPAGRVVGLGLTLLGSAGGLIQGCKCVVDPVCNKASLDFEGRSALDPNDKVGIGAGEAHWINNTETLSYGIRFENVDTASASAQVVIIRDTLDMSKLDITTFKPELFTIGNHTIDFSTNKTNQPLLYDMRPAINLIVRMEFILDSLSGEVKVVYTSLDPATMQLTTDPLLGFLPPNINKPDGEGSFYYSVKQKTGLPNNTVINNTANIYFDANDPILTPTWNNTIDILPPASKMNNIVSNTNDTTIYLSWQGSDAQSGVQKYDIMYSENGDAFQSYVTNFTNDSIRFTGKFGASYSFYTIAIDNVGNREVKSNAEVTVKINEQEVQIFPNPSNGEFTVQTKNDLQVLSISLFDLQGQKMPITYEKVNNTYKVQVPTQQNIGNYVLQILTKDKTISRKITIEK